ncbi:hypothetical protein [uncultured Acinetobacter sp.]|uniref:hypothetical protein n=1 Tax=uncultured Acinetobacter sp. TaxID=165433 RepID=UPI00259017C2|nr:hypothetical protein [uncultured Acinetobacter sp.]
MDKCKHGFDHACLICGFTHIDGKKVWFDWAWQEQQKQIDELSQENEKLRLAQAAYKKGVRNSIREQQKQIYKLQAQVDGAYVKLAMLRQTELWREDDIYELFEELEQALEGGEV